jgi:hypothetical protein
MLSIFNLSVIMLSIIILSTIMLNIVVLSVIILNLIILSDVILNVFIRKFVLLTISCAVMFNASIQNTIILSVIGLSVVAPSLSVGTPWFWVFSTSKTWAVEGYSKFINFLLLFLWGMWLFSSYSLATGGLYYKTFYGRKTLIKLLSFVI